MTDSVEFSAPEWEQREGEPNVWFARFNIYRLLGVGRTLIDAYRRERKSERRGRARSLPGKWAAAARRWQWKLRAAAWDLYEVGRREAELRAQQQREIELELLDGELLRRRARQVLESLPVTVTVKKGQTVVKPASAAEYNAAKNMLSEAARLNRLALGMPTAINQNTGSNLNVDLSQLTDEQIDRLSRGESLTNVLATGGEGRART